MARHSPAITACSRPVSLAPAKNGSSGSAAPADARVIDIFLHEFVEGCFPATSGCSLRWMGRRLSAAVDDVLGHVPVQWCQ